MIELGCLPLPAPSPSSRINKYRRGFFFFYFFCLYQRDQAEEWVANVARMVSTARCTLIVPVCATRKVGPFHARHDDFIAHD